MNIASNLARSAEAHPDRVAVKLDDAALSYSLLDGATQHIAGLLASKGVEPGDRVGVMLPNVPHFAVLYYGILRAGAVVVPMNPLLKQREVAFYLGNSGAKLIFAWELFAAEAKAGAAEAEAELVVVDTGGFIDLVGSAPAVAGVVDRAPDDTAVILYTSGTTGQPKGAELTHANLDRNIEACVNDIESLTPDDVMFGGLPLFHVFGQTCGLNGAIKAGACLTLLPRFDAKKALEILVRDKVTVFGGVPTMFVALVHHPDHGDYDLSTLRLCVSGGAAMPVEVMNAFEKEFGCVVLEGYGLSETSPVASFNSADERRPGSVGKPIAGVEFRIVDDADNDVPDGEPGEIVIRGHNVMKGYWNKPEETASAMGGTGEAGGGWFHTGDVGKRDADGFYYIVDRKKEMIIRGGYNVYPREIEEVLYEHPAVAEAAVIGVPHAELGEEIAAVLALKPGQSASPQELRDYVKSKVAAYKYPRTVKIVDALPKGPTGKILKREIKLESAG
ncbi:MAG TPA: long-chain fatty acid--CoA ligase [Streptosporangiaceae bacterium]|jgi:long-chain acyl-CoA synthetase|nr:long-chain fatty acid--CoA ligase [Streptosporangiaceae bacterium]